MAAGEAFAAEFAYATGRRHRKTNNLLTAGRKLELEKIVDLYAAADVVLTFRNVHNWMSQGNADQVFASFYKALKPGGILGVVQHRAAEGADPVTSAKTGNQE